MAIKQKTVMTIKLSGEGTSHSRTVVSTDGQQVVIDEPLARGGTDEGPTPTATAYAALVGCTNVIGHKCANKLDIDIGHLQFTMEVDFDRRGVLLMEEVDIPFKAIRLDVVSDGPCSAEELTRVGDETAKYCAIAKLFQQSGTDLNVSWRKI